MKVLLLLWSALLLSIATAVQPAADSLLPVSTGFAPVDGPVFATGSLENRRMILGGEFRTVNGQLSRNVAFLEEDGTPVAGFSLQLNGRVLAVETERNAEGGGFYIAGEFTEVNGVDVGRLARFHADGTFDIGFNANLGEGFNDTVRALLLANFTDGFFSTRLLMAAGDYTLLSGVPRNRLARMERTGVPRDWNTGANGPIHALAVDSIDRIVIGGQFTHVVMDGTTLPSANVDRIHSAGEFDLSFNPGTGPEGLVHAVAIDPRDDRIVIGGQFPSYRGTPVRNHLRLDTDGSADLTYDSAGTFIPREDTVRALFVLADGRVWLGKDREGADAPWCLAIFPATGGYTDGYFRSYGESVRAITRTASGAHFVGGNFRSTIDGRNFARFHESLFGFDIIYRDTSTNGDITEAAMGNDGSIYVIGNFTRLFGADRRYVAKLTPEGKVDMTFNAPWLDRRPLGITVDGGQVLLGGSFHTSRGSPASCLIRLNTLTGAHDPMLVLDHTLSAVNDTVLEIDVFGGGYVIIQKPSGAAARLKRVFHHGAVDPGFAAPAWGVGLLPECYNSRQIVATVDRILLLHSVGFEAQITRLLPSGAEDPAYSAITCDSGCTMMVPGMDGFIYLAGAFAHVGTGSRDRIARLQPGTHTLDGWKPSLRAPQNLIPGALYVRADGTLTVGYLMSTFSSDIPADEIRQVERLLPDGVSDPGQKFIRPAGYFQQALYPTILMPVSRPEWSGPAFLLGGTSAVSTTSQ